jgi:alkylhydroperoxidase family enzyme
LNFETSDRFDERQKAALAYTSMLVWNPRGADDAVWERLGLHFTEEQMVELGYFVALTYGQQRWIKTLGIGHGEVLNLGAAGLAPTEAEAVG